jgi:hypothetical protein
MRGTSWLQSHRRRLGLAGRARAGLFVFAVAACSGCMPSPALAIPEGRVYEMVSPVYKEGYAAKDTLAVEPQGESVVFTSRGGFAGALSGGIYAGHFYIAHRGSLGWSTDSYEPAFGGVSDISANLEYELASGPLAPNVGAASVSTDQVFQLHRSDVPDTAESWEVFGGIVLKRLDEGNTQAIEGGASADLCHVVLRFVEGPLLPEAVNSDEPIYDLTRGCDGEPPSLKLIGLTNNQTPTPINRSCQVDLGSGGYTSGPDGVEQTSSINSVDANGDEIFFTTNVQKGVENCYAKSAHQLFVRLDGARTLEVSRPLDSSKAFGGCVAKGVPGEVPCEGALTRASPYFKGASEDGSKVFFTTRAPLVSTDKDSSNDLYMAAIGCPNTEDPAPQTCTPSQREVTSLVQVSQDSNAKGAAEVQGMVNMARDGSHVYFVAQDTLASKDPTGEGVQVTPIKGAENLYVYDSVTQETAFVADLCSGPGRSGAVEDIRCSRSLSEVHSDAEFLWRSSGPEAQSTADGAFLVFDTYAQVVKGDIDAAKDVYRYNAQSGGLERVSIGEDYHDANGNDSSFDANILSSTMENSKIYVAHEMATRAVSMDGSRIVFNTADPLSFSATNSQINIYEWHEGQVSLVSSGTAEEDDIEATITASGRDLTFETAQGLASQDSDGLLDIYDARLEGGFPLAQSARQPCSGDACQGPLTNPAPLLVPGSASQSPGENFHSVSSKPAAKIKVKKKRRANSKGKVRKRRSSQRFKRALGPTGGNVR